jgi:aminopeptidase N
MSLLFKLALVLACASLTPLAPAQTAPARFDFDRTPGRLPKDVQPAHVALTLTLDPESPRFGGEATLTLRVRKPVPAIVLHAEELESESAVLLDATGERRLTVLPDAPTQTWRLVPVDGQPIAAGEVRLRLVWRGKVNDNDAGLFVAPFSSHGRPARWLATQLEAIYARRLLPSFDEPAFRSVFEVAVRAPKGLPVVANMPEVGQIDEGAQVLHRFAPTPPMPTYLLALMVGAHDVLEGTAAGVPLRILTAPGKSALATYALESTQKILPFYNDYFGVAYALPKLDQVAVPSARGGAMEDWGLISYAESALLFDPATSNPQTRRRIFSIIAHEVAHQWFGDLVTAASWEEIWLNEAFATWMAEKASERFNPDWQVSLRRRNTIDDTMGRDAGPATRAIRSGAVLEDRVFDVFDGITYTKGGAVLSMLEQWLGPPVFQRGLAAYMKARSFSNATAGDLWFHLGEAAGSDISAVASSWTDQAGFPLVSLASRCEGGQTRVELAQRRFSTAGEMSQTLWKIPLVLRQGDAVHRLLLEQPSQTLTLPGCPALPPLLNADGQGFYRVAYSAPQQAVLTQAFADLPPAARITLLSDTFAQAQAGLQPMAAYLDLLAALPRVQGVGRPALFAQARTGLAFLDDTLAGSPTQAALRSVARALLAPELQALGWLDRPGEDSEDEALRGPLLRDLARYDDAATIARARHLFDAEQAGGAKLPAGIRSAVLQAVGEHADAPRFAQLMQQLLRAESEEQRWALVRALSGVRDPVLAEQVFDLSLQGRLTPNMSAWLPGMVGDQPEHSARAYAFSVEHWPALARLAGGMAGGQAWLLPSAAQGAHTPEMASTLLADQRRLAGEAGAAPAFTQAAAIRLRAEVREREAARLAAPLAALSKQLAR